MEETTSSQALKTPRQNKMSGSTHSDTTSNQMVMIRKLHQNATLDKGQANLVMERLRQILE
nr:unnamed protein product [Callosobruchus analis]